MRLPICIIPKKHMLPNRVTYDSILKIICWSFEQLALGLHPQGRRDHREWLASDCQRKRKAGTTLPKSFLIEVRGDWSAYKSIFKLPGWTDTSGCCWLCNCTPSDAMDCGSNAAWRRSENRMNHFQVLTRMLQNHGELSPLMHIPMFQTTICQIDWLHVADLGVSLDFLGSLFHMMLPKFGSVKEEQVRNLHVEMQQFYARYMAKTSAIFLFKVCFVTMPT